MTVTQPQKKYSRFRTVEELDAECRKRGLKLNTKKFDEGSDYVSVVHPCKFKGVGTHVTVLISMVNGRFFGAFPDETMFSSDNNKHDDQPWFQSILSLVYVE